MVPGEQGGVKDLPDFFENAAMACNGIAVAASYDGVSLGNKTERFFILL